MTIVPQPGDFGLTQIHGGAGRAIRIGQWLNGDGYHDYEHAFVYLGDGLLAEAEPGGARVMPLSEYDDCTVAWSTGHFALKPEEAGLICMAARSYVGTPYSFLDYGTIAAHRLRIWAPHLRAYVASTGHMICSQLVARCYYDAGRELFRGWTGDVTPGDLYGLIGG